MRRSALFVVVLLSAAAFAQSLPGAELTASDATTNPGYLGWSVGAGGSTIAAGAPYASNGMGGRGVVYVFTKPVEKRWHNTTESARLIAPGFDSVNGLLGVSVAVSLSEDVIAVGTYDTYGVGMGIYVFVKPAQGWSGTILPTALLYPSAAPRPWIQTGNVGVSVAISAAGDIIVGGAPTYGYTQHFHNQEFVPASLHRGAAYIFVQPSTGWTGTGLQILNQATVLSAADGSAEDAFGGAVAISANTIVVGASGADSEASGAGAAYLYAKPKNGDWVDRDKFLSKLTVSNARQSDQLGMYVAAANGGGLIAVSSGRGCGQGFLGAAFVYIRPQGGWPAASTQSAELTAQTCGNSGGAAIAAQSGTVVTGGFISSNTVSFTEPVGGWSGTLEPTSRLTATKPCGFGASVGLGSHFAAIGAECTTVQGTQGAGAV